MPYSLAHGNGILTTASDLLFIGQPDGNLLALDARDGDELWRFQTGAAISASPITYEIDGEQYIAVYAGGTGIPYGNSAPRGDNLWAFKIGRQVAAGRDADAARRPSTRLRRARRRHVSSTTLSCSRARTTLPPTQSARRNPRRQRDGANAPARARRHDGDLHQSASNPNTHCATQFFEGLFNFRLAPGESATYTFDQAGEYFFNDCFSPRPTGKVE